MKDNSELSSCWWI